MRMAFVAPDKIPTPPDILTRYLVNLESCAGQRRASASRDAARTYFRRQRRRTLTGSSRLRCRAVA